MYAPSPYGGYANVPPPPEREQSALAGAFPIWLTLAAPLVMLLTLGIAFFAEVFLLGSDWATGALAASLAAFALAVVTVIALIVRVARWGQWRSRRCWRWRWSPEASLVSPSSIRCATRRLGSTKPPINGRRRLTNTPRPANPPPTRPTSPASTPSGVRR